MKYDVTVIGSGPGGYVAAIRCAQLGFKTAIIEKYDTLGGTCLNVGCIPSKALLDSSERYHDAAHKFEKEGISIKDLSVDMPKMIERKAQVVKENVQGVDFLMKKNKIEVFHGWASFKDKHHIKVEGKDEEQTVETDKVIIATGSKPTILPFMNYDKKRVITSTEALELQEVPKHMIVIGAGVIGAEMGSVFGRLGSKVTFIEFADRMIPTMDKSMGKELQKAMRNSLDVDFHFKTKVTNVENKGDQVHITAENKKGDEVSFEGDYCLVSIGRSAYTEKLGLENVGLETNDRGQVEVNEKLQTKVDNIYAIGDVIKGAMLAHKAEEEGAFVAEVMAGEKPHINYLLIPGVVYTWPEVASVGHTEEELKEQGREYKKGQFPFKASGRARASMDTDGLVKVLADKESDEILGMHIIGPRAADMIAEGVVAMEYRASAEDLARMSHAHPTYTEAIREACMAASDNRAIHI